MKTAESNKLDEGDFNSKVVQQSSPIKMMNQPVKLEFPYQVRNH